MRNIQFSIGENEFLFAFDARQIGGDFWLVGPLQNDFTVFCSSSLFIPFCSDFITLGLKHEHRIEAITPYLWIELNFFPALTRAFKSFNRKIFKAVVFEL